MKNNGLFSSLFIENLKERVALDDAARGRMATLAQTWHVRKTQDTELLWESFLKRALSYLEFVPSGRPDAPGVYPLYEDWGFTECVSVLYLAPPGSDIDDSTVGRFYPAKLIARLKERKLNWGILTDGSRWRLYSTKSSRPYEDYVELPLAETIEGSDEAEYGLFERFFHRDSFVAALPSEATTQAGDTEDTKETGRDKSAGIYKCKLDHDRDQSEQVLDERVKKPFLAQVDEVLQYICNGFIFETQKSGEKYTEKERAEIFESAVKLIYRCLFLFYAEARRLLPTDPDKADFYQQHSIQVLCLEAHKFRWGKRRDTDQYDLWKHLKGLINAVNDGDLEYGIMGYNGGLFDDEEERFLGQYQLRNDFLYRALYLLAFVEPFDSEPDGEYPIPYEDLEVRHLGELHETILEYTVQLADADRIRRRTKKGIEILLVSQTQKKVGDTPIKKGNVYFGESALERKQTGSYYTPESLVRFLNEKTIIIPLREIFEQKYRQRFNDLLEQASNGHDIGTRRGAAQSAAMLVVRFAEDELLKFKVCDLAMGSGHFLVDAANQMAGLVIALLAEVPYVEGMTVSVSSDPNYWRRRITRHCIYGVDLNPLAVNLTKLSLWLNCFATHHRLTFLDHHVRCGNSLIGIRSLKQLATIPERKKDGKKKKDDKAGKLFPNFKEYTDVLAEVGQDVQSISAMDEDETGEQKSVFDRAQQKVALLKPLADLYTSYLMDGDIRPDDYHELFYSLAKKQKIHNSLNPDLPKFLEMVETYQDRHHFFHWPFEFPDVFGPDATGGFFAVVGNPPWDTWNPKTQEFFSTYDSSFRELTNRDAKKRADELCKDLNIEKAWNEYQSIFYESAIFFQNDTDYAHQDIQPPGSNLYKLFLERDFHCLSKQGRMGLVLPSGFYTDSATKELREYLINANAIASIYCFENRFPVVFKSVHNQFKFITLCITKGRTNSEISCAFMQHDPESLPMIEKRAVILKPEDIVKFSPDSLSITEFNSQKDVDIARRIYAEFPLLGDTDSSLPWTFPLHSVEFNMTHQSAMFQKDIDGYVLYEGKMINQFDHENSSNNWAVNKATAETYLANKERFRIGRNSNLGKAISSLQLIVPLPLSNYRFGVRSIGRSSDARALITTVLPKNVCIGNSLFTALPWEYSCDSKLKKDEDGNQYIPCSPNYSYEDLIFVVCLLNSFVYDWLMGMKISANLNVFILKQLPLPRLTNENFFYSQIIQRGTRLICTTVEYADLWKTVYNPEWNEPYNSYPADVRNYGPAHEQEIRCRLRAEAKNLTLKWESCCGVHDRLPDREDTGDRAQLRAEIDAYVAHLYGLSRDDFAYILDTFPVLKKKEKKAFGEFMSKRKCLEEYDRIGKIMDAEG